MSSQDTPAIIAHRGASGYIPEHTLAAKALACAMGADFVEQDVVASRDDELLVLHDIHLDRVSDVSDVFPGRHRDDGRYYVRDFDLPELRTLTIREREKADGTRVYPGRFPARSGNFRIHTLGEELQLVAALNDAMQANVGVYAEIKRPAWHREEGVDIAPLFLDELHQHGYREANDPVFVQCFDADELRRVRHQLGSKLPLIQLIGENNWRESPTDFDALKTKEGLQTLAETVQGIGPWISQLYCLGGANTDAISSTGLVESAHEAGLLVHPYTVRSDDLPAGFESLDELVRFLACELGADGLFTDFPDKVRELLAHLDA